LAESHPPRRLVLTCPWARPDPLPEELACHSTAPPAPAAPVPGPRSGGSRQAGAAPNSARAAPSGDAATGSAGLCGRQHDRPQLICISLGGKLRSSEKAVDCCSTEALEQQFGPKVAAAELRRYRRCGAGPTTRLLLRGVRAHLPPDASLLDIGGGIGVLHHELLAGGVTRAWAVEPSAAFLQAAEAEARRRGHAGRVEFIHADIRMAAAIVPEADIVTLDRVVCCDPDYEQLLRLALGKARRILACSYPRDRVAVRGGRAAERLAAAPPE
jgi:SAM-dependent methyltransferase